MISEVFVYSWKHVVDAVVLHKLGCGADDVANKPLLTQGEVSESARVVAIKVGKPHPQPLAHLRLGEREPEKVAHPLHLPDSVFL